MGNRDAIHAGFWRRFAAFILDFLIIDIAGSILCTIIISMGTLLFLHIHNGSKVVIIVFGIIGWFIGWCLYFILMESSKWQATLGKRAMGIKVIDGRGGRIRSGRATGRFFGKIISRAIFYIGFMMTGWTERKQALHDKMAGTYVVFNTVDPNKPLPTQRPPMPWYG
jgi:uncharacterized RDD family membrane protein YckC